MFDITVRAVVTNGRAFPGAECPGTLKYLRLGLYTKNEMGGGNYMLNRMFIRALAIGTFFVAGSFALGANDCCFDWGIHPIAGADDDPTGFPGGVFPPKKLPTGNFARCTDTVKTDCFKRAWRQVYLIDYHCDTAYVDPDDPSNLNDGIECVKKMGSDRWKLHAQKSYKANDLDLDPVPPTPSTPEPSFTQEDCSDPSDCPTLSVFGMVAIAGLTLGAGGIVICRRKENLTPRSVSE
jgi:hypothetical protein